MSMNQRKSKSTSLPKKKAVIVVHGMGLRKKNSFLLEVVNPIARWIQRASDLELQISPDLKSSANESEPSEVNLIAGSRSWTFAEAWWAESFSAPKFDPMVGWVFWRFLSHIGSLLRTTGFYTLLPALAGLAYVVRAVYLVLWIAVLSIYFPYFVFARFCFFLAQSIFKGVFRRGDIAAANPIRVFQRAWDWGYFKKQALKASNPLTFYLRIFLVLAPAIAIPAKWTDKVRKRLEADRGDEGLALKLASVLGRVGSDEAALASLLQNEARRSVGLWVLLILTILFHMLTAVFLLVFYVAAMPLFVALMIFVWLLSLVSVVPGIPRLINAVKKPLDVLLVGSLGDIKVFLEDPVQAQLIRSRFENVLRRFSDDEAYDSVFVIAHSTGAAIVYETLALEYNGPITQKVKAVFTAGSILNMVWARPHRPSLDRALRSDIKWVNFWTKYDPALAGPVPLKRRTGRFIEHQVTNSESLLDDHTSYWGNYRQVISRIVGEIWDSDEDNPFFRTKAEEDVDTAARKARLSYLTFPRLLAWYSPLFVLASGYEGAANILRTFKSVLTTLNLEGIANRLVISSGNQTVTIGLAAVLTAALALLAHKLYKDLIWDYFVIRRGLGI